MKIQRDMDMIEKNFKIKEGIIEPPRVYLGVNCQKNPSCTDGIDCWGMSVNNIVKKQLKT